MKKNILLLLVIPFCAYGMGMPNYNYREEREKHHKLFSHFHSMCKEAKNKNGGAKTSDCQALVRFLAWRTYEREIDWKGKARISQYNSPFGAYEAKTPWQEHVKQLGGSLGKNSDEVKKDIDKFGELIEAEIDIDPLNPGWSHTLVREDTLGLYWHKGLELYRYE